MNTPYVLVRRKSCARGLSLHLFLDPSLDTYRVMVMKSGTIVEQTRHAFSKEEAEDLFDSYDLAFNERFGWRAVLARCMGKTAEKAPSWSGSPVQVAAHLFGIGTWEWVLALRAMRRSPA